MTDQPAVVAASSEGSVRDTTVDPRLVATWAVLDKVKAMEVRGPDAFKTGQEHLAPAFRQVNWHEAFRALAVFLGEIETSSGYSPGHANDEGTP